MGSANCAFKGHDKFFANLYNKAMAFKLTVLTLFPDLFPGPLAHSMTGRALGKGTWTLETINMRDFASGVHKSVDDTPYGGGAGMVMRADIVAAAIEKAKQGNPNAPVVYLTPSGMPYKQEQARDFAQAEGLILLCGHYEGIDQRVLDVLVDAEISIGDYVLTGGEVAAYPVADSVIRLLPGVLGGEGTLHEESFDIKDEHGQKLLEYPHYTRPEVWREVAVPDVLKSGHHANIQKWRLQEAKKRTRTRRPDLLKDE